MITFTAMPLIIKTNNFLILPFVTAMDINVTLEVFFKKLKKSPRVGTHGHFSQKFENQPL